MQRNSYVMGRLFAAMTGTEHFFQLFHNTGTTDEIGIASIRNNNYFIVRESSHCQASLRTLWTPLVDWLRVLADCRNASSIRAGRRQFSAPSTKLASNSEKPRVVYIFKL